MQEVDGLFYGRSKIDASMPGRTEQLADDSLIQKHSRWLNIRFRGRPLHLVPWQFITHAINTSGDSTGLNCRPISHLHPVELRSGFNCPGIDHPFFVLAAQLAMLNARHT